MVMAQRSLSLWVSSCSESNQNENVECSSEAQDSMDYSSLTSNLQVTSDDGDQHELAPAMVKKVGNPNPWSTDTVLSILGWFLMEVEEEPSVSFASSSIVVAMVYLKVLMELSFQSHSQNEARQQDLHPWISFCRINYQIHTGKLFLRQKCVMK